MGQLKLVWYDNGKHKPNSVIVYIKEQIGSSLSDVLSPTDITGSGGCFGTALEDFEEQLDEYISNLVKFRDEVVRTKRAYSDLVKVDCNGNPIL